MKLGTFLKSSAILFLLSAMSSCEAIGDIFKAGIWVGVLAVVVVLAIIFIIIGKMGSKS